VGDLISLDDYRRRRDAAVADYERCKDEIRREYSYELAVGLEPTPTGHISGHLSFGLCSLCHQETDGKGLWSPTYGVVCASCGAQERQ
jgi:hypothetical protein